MRIIRNCIKSLTHAILSSGIILYGKNATRAINVHIIINYNL